MSERFETETIPWAAANKWYVGVIDKLSPDATPRNLNEYVNSHPFFSVNQLVSILVGIELLLCRFEGTFVPDFAAWVASDSEWFLAAGPDETVPFELSPSVTITIKVGLIHSFLNGILGLVPEATEAPLLQ